MGVEGCGFDPRFSASQLLGMCTSGQTRQIVKILWSLECHNQMSQAMRKLVSWFPTVQVQHVQSQKKAESLKLK